MFRSTEEYHGAKAPVAVVDSAALLRTELQALDAEFEAKRRSFSENRAYEDRRLEQDYQARRGALMRGAPGAAPKRLGRPRKDAPKLPVEPIVKRPIGRPLGSRDKVPRRTADRPAEEHTKGGGRGKGGPHERR
jgi:hypothetical protein